MGKSLIQPPIKINFYYGRYLSSGCVMDGPAFTPWQDDGLWMPAAPCRGRSRTQQRWHQSNYCPPHHGNGGRGVEEGWGQRGGGCFIHTPAPPSLLPHCPVTLPARVMKALRAVMIGHRWIDGQIEGWINRFIFWLIDWGDSLFHSSLRCNLSYFFNITYTTKLVLTSLLDYYTKKLVAAVMIASLCLTIETMLV